MTLRDVDGERARFSQDENILDSTNWWKIKKKICKRSRLWSIVCGRTVLPQERKRTEGWIGQGGGREPLDPQEARWHPRPDVIFWQSKPVISGITLYSWLRPHGHIYSRRCNSRWESLQRNSDSSLKSCRNICRGYLITMAAFDFSTGANVHRISNDIFWQFPQFCVWQFQIYRGNQKLLLSIKSICCYDYFARFSNN